jgi:hypothetical protein
MDREGRIWMDTGQVDPVSNEPVIEMLNGESRGSFAHVGRDFGPLRSLSARSPRPVRTSLPRAG